MNFTIDIAKVPPVIPGTPAAAAHRKLVDAAQQFEGMLLQEMLKPMKEHGFCQQQAKDDGDGKETGSGFGETLNSFGTETLATAIAKGGGLGIAQRVVEQVEGERALHQRSAEAAKSPTLPK